MKDWLSALAAFALAGFAASAPADIIVGQTLSIIGSDGRSGR